MTTSRWPSIVDALLAAFAATDAALVLDGPNGTADVATDYVVVGGTEDPDDDAGEFDQDWRGLGAKARQETGTVTCAVLAATGDDDIPTTRARAFEILGQLETAARTDPTLGAAINSGWLHVTNGRASQRRNANGAYVRIVFTVSYSARI